VYWDGSLIWVEMTSFGWTVIIGMNFEPHPDRHTFADRLGALDHRYTVQFEGDLFRFIDPRFSRPSDIVDGKGALHAAGRWNLPGVSRLSYAALSPQTALAEALANVNYYRLPLAMALPRVLVALRLKAARVLDLREGVVRRALGISQATIRKTDWRLTNQKGREAVTQAWGQLFAAAGFEAVLVCSAADTDGYNVLGFPENLLPGSRFELIGEIVWPGR
jgi:RES domain-containing protein